MIQQVEIILSGLKFVDSLLCGPNLLMACLKCANLYVGGSWASMVKVVWWENVVHADMPSRDWGVINIWVSGKDTENKRTWDPNLKDTLLSHEMSWQENHPKYFWDRYFVPDLRWKHILQSTPCEWYLIMAETEVKPSRRHVTKHHWWLPLTNWLKGRPSRWVQIGWAISGLTDLHQTWRHPIKSSAGCRNSTHKLDWKLWITLKTKAWFHNFVWNLEKVLWLN